MSYKDHRWRHPGGVRIDIGLRDRCFSQDLVKKDEATREG